MASEKSFSSSSSRYSMNRAQLLKCDALEERKKIKETKSSAVTKSSWTPLGPNNKLKEKLFCERKDLVCNWFDKWNDPQRKEILHLLIEKCTPSQKQLINYIVHPQIPVLNTDFSRILPRCLVVYIFSFLDPRSLCRCARVSWYFKFLSESDECWMPKCVNLGWWPSFKVSPMETGVWKRLFVESIIDLRNGRVPAGNANFDRTEDGTNKDLTEESTSKQKENSSANKKESRKNESKRTMPCKQRRQKIKQLHPLRPSNLAQQIHYNEHKQAKNSNEVKPSEVKEKENRETEVAEELSKATEECLDRPVWARSRYLDEDSESNSHGVKTPGIFLQDLMHDDATADHNSDSGLFSARPWHVHDHEENEDFDEHF